MGNVNGLELGVLYTSIHGLLGGRRARDKEVVCLSAYAGAYGMCACLYCKHVCAMSIISAHRGVTLGHVAW